MKKIDFHIHTIPTLSDRNFIFDPSVLVKYVDNLALDAIAITNHNIFNKSQYESLCDIISIPIFPGIEINVENGHLLLITSKDDVLDFGERCDRITSLISTPTDYLTISQFKDIFPSLNKYILIPHYEKDPILSLDKLQSIREYITCGEVNSAKKFISCKKIESKLTPLFFSDIRIEQGMNFFPTRYTYIDLETITIPYIKQVLLDKSKVSLSTDNSHRLIDILSDGVKISTGLTVLLGERSSGKTYTLDRIADNIDNPKYIKQFSLLTKNSELDQKNFEEVLRNRCSSISEEYLSQFKNVVEDVKNIFLDRDDRALDAYISSLLKSASEADREDIFSKTKLFNEPIFDCGDLTSLQKLIDAVKALIENEEFSEIIYQFVSYKSLIGLSVALMKRYTREKELILKKSYINDIVENIKAELRIRTATEPIKDIDFYRIMMNKRKVERFTTIAKTIKKTNEIYSKDLHSYKLVASVGPFTGAQELKNLSGKIISFSDAFEKYVEPYNYLCVLRSKSDLPVSDYYKYFVKVKYEVLNKHGFRASGGERAEYNLLEELADATQYDILLLDEPESSFDNLFLKSNVNKLIKDISQIVPIVIATHNNTIGASINPDYILHTRKLVDKSGAVNYQIFSGFPSSTFLKDVKGQEISKHDVLLDCLEAGESSYIERRIVYEMLDD